MNETLVPQKDTVYKSVDLEVVAYKCINCGAALEGAHTTCRFCGTNYQLESNDTANISDGFWIRVNPDFPDLTRPGTRRDEEKENQIEQNIIERVSQFYQEQIQAIGQEQADAFMRILMNAANKSRISIRGSFRDGESLADFFAKERHSLTGNQENVVRLFPSLMNNEEFWTQVVSLAYNPKSGFRAEQIAPLKRALEEKMGLWVKFDGGQPATEKNPTSVPEKSPSLRSKLSAIFNQRGSK